MLCTVRDCHQPLALADRRAVCPRNHSYDRARSGYWNLLQPQDRKSKEPGDSAEAVAARRRFVDAGHADALHAALTELLRGAQDTSLKRILDVGCGEGFHLGGFHRDLGAPPSPLGANSDRFRASPNALGATPPHLGADPSLAADSNIEAFGVDLSVSAIDIAARRYRDCTFVVANADRFLPFEDGSLDVVTSITARMPVDDIRRVLAGGGIALIVIPAPDDLIELRAAVLGSGDERDRVERTRSAFAARFVLLRHERFRVRLTLDRAAIHDIMSSSYRGLRARERERLAQLDTMDVTSSRDILLFRTLDE